MSETKTRPGRPALADPFGSNLAGMSGEPEVERLPAAIAPRVAGTASDRAMADIITAQRVPIKRDIGRVLQSIQAAANAAGQKFYYAWEANDRANNRKQLVEGLGIKGAMAVATLYGNCRVDCAITDETQTEVRFAARFVDFETGFTLTRLFSQRKSQSLGMKDAARSADLVFQIGQSKAIRNVIVQALPLYCEEALAAAKSALIGRIEKNPDAARARMIERFEEAGIALPRVERIVGRPAAKWLARDMAKLHAELVSVEEGMADPDDIWPEPEAGEKPAEKPQAETKPAPQQREQEPDEEAQAAPRQGDGDLLGMGG